jgi:hypothetical protein
MNWGTSIAFVYALFALSMIGVVFASRKHDPGLVQKDYYQLDLDYQTHLEKKQNAAQLLEKPQVYFDHTQNTLVLSFPESLGDIFGQVKVYQSKTTKRDFILPIKGEKTLALPAEKLHYGRWHLALDWQSQGKAYFLELATFVPSDKP